MIYSPAHNIAFAHYPKCGGTSMTDWFKNTFDDADFLEKKVINEIVSHLSVKKSLEVLEQNRSLKFIPKKLKCLAPSDIPNNLRIIGILRDPFDMLVSLFEFWKNVPRSCFKIDELPEFIQVAREGDFLRFIELAVVHEKVETYKSFFDVGGPVWPQTYLLPFENLENALAKLSVELELPASKAGLNRLNVNPKPDRRIHTYLYEASSLLADVEQHFSWYYSDAFNHLYQA